jgi:hypothetical protein
MERIVIDLVEHVERQDAIVRCSTLRDRPIRYVEVLDR